MRIDAVNRFCIRPKLDFRTEHLAGSRVFVTSSGAGRFAQSPACMQFPREIGGPEINMRIARHNRENDHPFAAAREGGDLAATTERGIVGVGRQEQVHLTSRYLAIGRATVKVLPLPRLL